MLTTEPRITIIYWVLSPISSKHMSSEMHLTTHHWSISVWFYSFVYLLNAAWLVSLMLRTGSTIFKTLKHQSTCGYGHCHSSNYERSVPKSTTRLRRVAHCRTVAEILLATNTMCLIDPTISEGAATVVCKLAFAIIHAVVTWINPTSAQRRANWSRGCWRYCKIRRWRRWCKIWRWRYCRRSVCVACSWYRVVRLTWAGAAIECRVAAVRVLWTTGSWRISAVGSVCDSAIGLRSY